MLDINYIIAKTDEVKKAVKNKGIKIDIDELLRLHTEKKKLQQDIEALQQKRNANAASIKQVGKPDKKTIEEGKKLKENIAELEPRLRDLENKLTMCMLRVPNIPSHDTPVGPDETHNKELRTWGSVPEFSFKPKDHAELGTELDLIDFERGVKAVGFRGYFLKGDLARLHWALLSYSFEKMIAKGYTPMITPALVNDVGMVGSGWFPLGKEEVYAVDDKYLSGTAEVALLAYHANETLTATELPKKYVGFSPCFRREAGSYGKDTKGLYRVHEFWKIEQVIVCENDIEKSSILFEELLSIAEEIVRDLELPYRVLQICTGDMGLGKYKMYDIETWMPSRNAYGETHSCSHLTDWQARRLNLRYRDHDGKLQYPYTLNNTVVASPRILIALLENYQHEDGTVAIPKVLQKYMGGQKSIT